MTNDPDADYRESRKAEARFENGIPNGLQERDFTPRGVCEECGGTNETWRQWIYGECECEGKTMGKTGISWCDKVWNPVVGCSFAHTGCQNCYAKSLHDKRHKAVLAGCTKLAPQYAKPFSEIQLLPERLEQPLHWRKPCSIFVNSVSDLFHDDVPTMFIPQVLAIPMLASRHTFIILTKRSERMSDLLTRKGMPDIVQGYAENICDSFKFQWPLPNVYLGFSASNQETFDSAWPHMAQLAAAGWKVVLSAEPLVGGIKFNPEWWQCPECLMQCKVWNSRSRCCDKAVPWLSGVIVGGESGNNARPMHPEWARSLRNQCQDAGIPYYFKAWGEWNTIYHEGRAAKKLAVVYPDGRIYELADEGQAKAVRLQQACLMWMDNAKFSGRVLDGRTHDDLPWRVSK